MWDDVEAGRPGNRWGCIVIILMVLLEIYGCIAFSIFLFGKVFHG